MFLLKNHSIKLSLYAAANFWPKNLQQDLFKSISRLSVTITSIISSKKTRKIPYINFSCNLKNLISSNLGHKTPGQDFFQQFKCHDFAN